MFRAARPDEEVRERGAGRIALRRLGQPADIAGVVALVAGEDARAG
jgi:NAD(P)-dependent dehydrogenase (short-subunit alcohol dehydrogenase family)